MTRLEVLTVVAERYRELTDPLNGPGGIRGDGDSLTLTPHERGCGIYRLSPPICTCAYSTVREFERLTTQLRTVQRAVWWHLSEHHLKATTRTVWRCPSCKLLSQHSQHSHRGKSGRPHLVDAQRVVFTDRHPRASESVAQKALQWIASEWGLAHEPMLPDELKIAA